MKKKSVYIALGYFDSVHKGHKKVIDTAKRLATESGVLCAVFTFKKDISRRFGKTGSVFTYNERVSRLYDLGADEILSYPVSKSSLSLGKVAFLNRINEKYNILGYICGEDYRFGKGGKGDINYLKEYAEKHNQTITVIPVYENGYKISTGDIKKLLENGEVEKANELLTKPYSLTGKVFKDRGVGKNIGFPTANFFLSGDTCFLKNGVYYGEIEINGVTYGTIINYGARPTFGLDKVLAEVHIKGFNGNLYGKEITVAVKGFLRDIKKFNTVEELKIQLEKDLGAIND